MNELTKITIVTISYNSEKTIERTIQSVISQKYDNTEYWIIDGKSTDSTMKIVKEYAEKYDFIKYISEKDNGISDAFNKGIKKSTGELIGLINSDDCLAEGALQTVNEIYLKTKADVIYGDTIVHDVDNGLTLYKHAGKPEQLKYEMPFIHQSSFIKRSVYEEYGMYSSEYKICMDYDMLARIFRKGCTFANTEKILSIFQYGGTSCQHPVRTINEDMKIAIRYGLSNRDARKYKIKHIPVSLIKFIMSNLRIWSGFYCVIKRKSVIKNKK